MPSNICPVCGSQNLKKKNSLQTINEKYGGEKDVNIVEYVCDVCGSEGDLFHENDTIIETAISELKNKVASNILETFSKEGYNLSSMERVLELPQRTLAKWKSGSVSPSAAGITLLKFIRTFPWMLNVAESGFDYSISQRLFLTTALQKVIAGMRFENNEFTHAGCIATTNASVFFMHSEKQDSSVLPNKTAIPVNPTVNVQWSVQNEG